MIPVYNYVKTSVYDDLSWQSCNYAATNRGYKYYNEQSYADYSPYVLKVMKGPIASAFNLTPNEEQNMVYTQFYNYSDILISEIFEGNKKRYNFSELQWSLARNS